MFLMGHLQQRPRDAWTTTLIEYDAAFRGYCERHGIKPEGDGMTRAGLEALKAQFPD